MIVKICGIRSLADAEAASEAGADMLGFNFFPRSPRFVQPGACAGLTRGLRKQGGVPVLVGVFVNSPLDAIEAILDACMLDFAQLHGDETPETVAALGGRAFKAIRPASPAAARADADCYRQGYRPDRAPDLLLDASAPGLYGGSGQTADWRLARELARASRLLLAGGLRPDNVAEAVAAVRPWGVDVASGVESAPGVKDAAKMRRFVEAARAAGNLNTRD